MTEKWPDVAARYFVAGRGPAPLQPADDVDRPYSLFYHDSMYIRAGGHVNAQVNSCLKNPKKFLMEFVWGEMKRRHRELTRLPENHPDKEYFTGRIGEGVLDSRSLGRGQGEASLSHFTTRAVLSMPRKYPAHWHFGPSSGPTALPPWLKEKLGFLNDSYGDLLCSPNRTGEYLFQLFLAKGCIPLIDQVTARVDTRANLGEAMFKIAEYISFTRQIPHDSYPGREGIILDLCTLANDVSLTDEEYYEKADIEGSLAWSAFSARVEHQAKILGIPQCKYKIPNNCVLPISIDIEDIFTIAGADQTANVDASIQLTFLGTTMTILLPVREVASNPERQMLFSRAERRHGGKWTETKVREVATSVERHPTRFLDKSTAHCLSTNSLPTSEGFFLYSGSGVQEDFFHLDNSSVNAPEERRVTGGIFVETHRLLRLCHVVHQRTCFGMVGTALACLGVASASKVLEVYTRQFYKTPEQLSDALEFYRVFDSFTDCRSVWSILLCLCSKMAPLTSKPAYVSEEEWFSFSLSCFLLEAAGPSSNPELDARRFSAKAAEENEIVIKECEKGLDSYELFDCYGSTDCLNMKREPVLDGHERAVPTGKPLELDNILAGYAVPGKDAKQSVKNKFEKRHGVNSEKHQRLCDFWAHPRLALMYERVGMAPSRCVSSDTDLGTPLSPNLQGEGTSHLAVRLLYEMGEVVRLNVHEQFSRPPEDHWDYAFIFASYFRRAWGMERALPYKQRLLLPPQVDVVPAIPVVRVHSEHFEISGACIPSHRTSRSVSRAGSSSPPARFSRSPSEDLVERDVDSRDRAGMEEEPQVSGVSKQIAESSRKRQVKRRTWVNNLSVISEKLEILNQTLMKDTGKRGRSPSPEPVRSSSSGGVGEAGENTRRILLVDTIDVDEPEPSAAALPVEKDPLLMDTDRSRSEEVSPSKRKRVASRSSSPAQKKTKGHMYHKSVRFMDLVPNRWLHLYNTWGTSSDVDWALNPVSHAEWERLVPDQRAMVTGLEGYRILDIKNKEERLNWVHSWGPIPQEFIDRDTFAGILPTSFSYRDHGGQVLEVIKKNPRHWRVAQLAQRLGSQLMRSHPPEFYSWGDYFRCPTTLDAGVVQFPPNWLRRIANAMGVRGPRGVVGSTYQVSKRRRLSRLENKRHREARFKNRD